MIKKFLISLSLLLFAAGTVQAASQSPEDALRSTVEQLQSLIQKHYKEYKANPQTFYDTVDKVVVPSFDVPYISQLVLARYWRTASPQQRKDFEDAFETMLIRSYANALLDNANSTKVEWKPSRVDADAKRATVDTVLVQDSGQKYPISFSVHLVDGNWKIYDIIINNISLALNFRSQIASDVKRSGLDAVIKRMQTGQMVKPATGS